MLYNFLLNRFLVTLKAKKLQKINRRDQLSQFSVASLELKSDISKTVKDNENILRTTIVEIEMLNNFCIQKYCRNFKNRKVMKKRRKRRQFLYSIETHKKSFSGDYSDCSHLKLSYRNCSTISNSHVVLKYYYSKCNQLSLPTILQ